MLACFVIAMTCGTLLEQPGFIWAEADKLVDGPVKIVEAGDYRVWVHANSGEPSAIGLGSTTLRVAAGDASDGAGRRWIAAGTQPLEAGALRVTTEGPVETVVLTKSTQFDPEKAALHVYAQGHGERVPDARLTINRDTDSVYSMTPFESLDEWEAYAATLRRKLLVGCGLWPLPTEAERTPLNAQVAFVAEHDDYSVARVYFEALPGFFVTGNLYRPAGDRPFPGVISPHGHWEHGRLEHGERGSVPARGITLARMGMVAFNYDMLGYNDSMQFDHGFGDFTEDERKRLELWGIHPFALQLWSSIRAVDFLQSLDFVDPDNIACTGASGGGTQTFALSAVDLRVKVSAPVNMISHTMQGGCICENAPLIRFQASNMEIGALAAPRPLMLVSATGDWTKATPSVEYPAIRGIYGLYKAEDRVETIQIDAPHNYNQPSREAVYRFFGRWVLDQGEQFAAYNEPAAVPEPIEVQRVFPDGKLPDGAISSGAIIDDLIAARRAQWAALLPSSKEAFEGFRTNYGSALSDVTGAHPPEPGSVSAQTLGELEDAHYRQERLVITRGDSGEQIPGLLYLPKGGFTQGGVVLVHGDGKAALADLSNNRAGELVSTLVREQEFAVLVIDVFGIGEARGERQYGKFPTTFLPADAGYRIQDILTALAYLRGREDISEANKLVGLGDAGIWCLFASALDGAVQKTVVDINGFNPDDDESWMSIHFMPSVQSVGGVVTASAMITPRGLHVFNTGNAFETEPLERLFAIAAPDQLKVQSGPLDAADLAKAL